MALFGPQAWLDGFEGGLTYVRTYGRMDVGKISPFYRTLSPIGAAAQKAKFDNNVNDNGEQL